MSDAGAKKKAGLLAGLLAFDPAPASVADADQEKDRGEALARARRAAGVLGLAAALQQVPSLGAHAKLLKSISEPKG